MRVPFMISWGSKLSPRVDEDLLLSVEDFCPTILSLMGLENKIPSSVQTRNLSKQIQGSRKNMPKYQLYMRYNQVNSTGKIQIQAQEVYVTNNTHTPPNSRKESLLKNIF